MDELLEMAFGSINSKPPLYSDSFIIDNYEPWRKINFKFPMLFRPCTALEPYISCYWLAVFTGTVNDAMRLKPKTVVLLPDGGSSIVFDINRSQNKYSGYIHGVMDHPITVYNQHSISRGEITTFAVDFKPGSFHRLFNISMKQLCNTSPLLESISSSVFNEITDRIVNAGSVAEQINIIESFLIKQMTISKYSSSLIDEALFVLNSTGGSIRVGELAHQLFISERGLNRLFHEHVGLSPKTLCRIIRLQNALKMCCDNSQTDFLMAALDSGYFDQSHFIRDFKELCGCTPGKFNFK